MTNPWRIALVVALVILGIGGGTCALRTARMVEKQVKEQKVNDEGSGDGK
jgi:hypothetical protein